MIASPQMCVPSGDGANGPKFTGKMDLARELLLLVVAEQVNAVQVRIVRRGEDNEKIFDMEIPKLRSAVRVPYCSKLGYCHGGRLPFDEAQLEITVSHNG